MGTIPSAHGGYLRLAIPMKKTIRTNNPGLCFLIAFWSKYCTLQDWHIEWARTHVKVQSELKKDQYLYLQGEAQKNVYFATKGMLARTDYHPDTGKQRILSVALPGMALMTTDHLYSHTPSKGDIVVLRSRSRIVEIPYRAIREFKEKEPHIDTLIDVLGNKKRKQMMALRRIMFEPDAFKRYLQFEKDMPQLTEILTQIEQAQLLSIGRNTVQRAQYFLLTGQRPKTKPH